MSGPLRARIRASAFNNGLARLNGGERAFAVEKLAQPFNIFQSGGEPNARSVSGGCDSGRPCAHESAMQKWLHTG